MRKHLIILSIPFILFAACNNDNKDAALKDDKNLLSTDLVNNPRSANGTDEKAFEALPTMDFKDTLHDFGTIKKGEIVTYDFEFTNNGKEPLIISNATGSCGCTVADYPREPIAPGKPTNITVKFSSIGKHGHQEKSVTLTTNSKRGTHMLFIKADVDDKEQ